MIIPVWQHSYNAQQIIKPRAKATTLFEYALETYGLVYLEELE